MSENNGTAPVSLNLYQRIIKIYNDISFVQKETAKVNNQFRPISVNAVIAHCRPSMITHGVLILPGEDCVAQSTIIPTKGWRSDVIMSFFCVNVDNPSERFNFKIPSSAFDSLDKDISKAVTSAMKAALLKIFLLETGDEAESKYDLPDAPTEDQKKAAAPVSLAAAKELAELSAKAGVPQEVVASSFGVQVLAHVPAEKFAEARDRLLARIEKLKEKEPMVAA